MTTPKRYAADTSVGIDTSIFQIKDMVRRRGATNVESVENDAGGRILFEMHDRTYLFRVIYSPLSDPAFQQTPSGRWARTETEARKEWEKHKRARWRAIKLLIQALWTAVDDGWDHAKVFFPWLLVERYDGTMTDLYEAVQPQIAASLQDRRLLWEGPSASNAIALPAPNMGRVG